MLFKLSKNLLPIYRDAFKRNLPKSTVSVGLLDYYIDRFNKHPEWENKVHFYGAKDSKNQIDEQANFVVTLGSFGQFIYFDSLADTPDKILLPILNELDYKDDKVFVAIQDEFRNLMHAVIDAHSLEKVYDSRAKIITITNYEALKPKFEQLISG